ncbi:hypothetical protein QVD99_005143 [Batrachochytrium dendrobatidis]|nr:hypothetical protein QVD99_005143 [Batrachochytrium dendrobatidis]
MKLAVAVLSSILLACSVTIANPIDPSATTSTEAITSPTPNPNGIGISGLDPLSDSVKDLLDKYIELEDDRNEQGKKCKLLQSEYDSQIMLVWAWEQRFMFCEVNLEETVRVQNMMVKFRRLGLILKPKNSNLGILEKVARSAIPNVMVLKLQ